MKLYDDDNDVTDPLCILKEFITPEVIEMIVRSTNDYAQGVINHPPIQEHILKTKRSVFQLWMPVNSDEIWIYFCITFLMGIIQKPNYASYWSTEPIMNTPIFSRLMRRDRFQQIRSMIHFSQPFVENDDALKKIRELFDHVNRVFGKKFSPDQELCIDEYLSLWKGRLSFRVYIPNKRERYGIKMYMLCESRTGYLLGIIIYTGATSEYPEPSNTFLHKPFAEFGNPSKVVMSLRDKYLGQGYSLTVDNLYTSPELAKFLYENRTDIYGTLRRKKGLPEDFWNWKPTKGEPPQVMFCGHLLVLRWNDVSKEKSNKLVSMLSTKHTGKLVFVKNHFRTKEPIYKPDVIVDYNRTMGGG